MAWGLRGPGGWVDVCVYVYVRGDEGLRGDGEKGGGGAVDEY